MQPITAKTTLCEVCNPPVNFKNPYQFKLHRKSVHPELLRKNKNKVSVGGEDSPLARIIAHERQIQKEILNLETERQFHHDHVVRIDNLINRYKKFQQG